MKSGVREEKKLSWAEWLILLVFGLAAFFHLRGSGPVRQGSAAGVMAREGQAFSRPAVLESGEQRRLLLFILDFRDFSCMVCLESFLELHRRLPLRVKTEDTWGVLVVPRGREKDGTAVGIAGKKLEGFVRAHRILFPILVDSSRILGEMAEKGSGLVLFDEGKRTVSRFDFPLKSEQFREILEIFAE